jgi:thioredoxin-dependent peroxiredoxin
MARLIEGQQAPDFSLRDIDGKTHKLEQYRGKYLLLSFYRYASCPFCNLRISQVMQRIDGFRANDLEILSIFQSPEEKIKQYVGKQHPPFAVVPDPERRLYQTYRLETSWTGMLTAMIFRMGDVIKAFSKGFGPGTMEGEKNRLPADFLIGPDGTILEAYYGKDIGDHMPFETIDRIITKTQLEPELV